MQKFVVPCVLLIAFNTVVFAGSPPAPDHRRGDYILSRFDSNGDQIVTQEEFLNSAHERFVAMDINADQKITLEEFTQRYQDFKPKTHSSHHAQINLAEGDNNKDGKISETEYLKASQQHAEEMFKQKDLNGDKQLSPEELRPTPAPLKMLSGEDLAADKVFAKLDVNHDNVVTEQEYHESRKQWFSELDRDHDNKLTREELAK
jgi:Ca2+-binding EF-hand superfamily protein